MEEHRTIKGVQPSVIIGTPGRMNDHLSKQNFDADTVSILIIDEFDKCLEFGFQEEMATVIGQLPNLQRRFLLSLFARSFEARCRTSLPTPSVWLFLCTQAMSQVDILAYLCGECCDNDNYGG